MKQTDDPLLVSYRELRRGVGLIGIGLPIALPLLGWIVLGEGVRDSISSYYWAAAGNGILVGSVFVGALCSIGVFLWSYRGDGKWDNRAGNLACIGVGGGGAGTLRLTGNRCRVEFDFYYPPDPDAVERWERDLVFSDAVQKEDVSICEHVQRGLASGSYVAGRLNTKRESGVHHFHDMLRAAYRAAAG